MSDSDRESLITENTAYTTIVIKSPSRPPTVQESPSIDISMADVSSTSIEMDEVDIKTLTFSQLSNKKMEANNVYFSPGTDTFESEPIMATEPTVKEESSTTNTKRPEIMFSPVTLTSGTFRSEEDKQSNFSKKPETILSPATITSEPLVASEPFISEDEKSFKSKTAVFSPLTSEPPVASEPYLDTEPEPLTFSEESIKSREPKLSTKMIVSRSRENLDILRLEEAKRAKEQAARQLIEEQKEKARRAEEEKRILKEKREFLLETIKKERLEKETKAAEKREQRDFEKQAFIASRQMSTSCNSIISTIGINDDGTYTGRVVGDNDAKKSCKARKSAAKSPLKPISHKKNVLLQQTPVVKPVIKKPVVNKPVVNKPVVNKQVVIKQVADKPSISKDIPPKKIIQKPVKQVEKPITADEPVAGTKLVGRREPSPPIPEPEPISNLTQEIKVTKIAVNDKPLKQTERTVDTSAKKPVVKSTAKFEINLAGNTPVMKEEYVKTTLESDGEVQRTPIISTQKALRDCGETPETPTLHNQGMFINQSALNSQNDLELVVTDGMNDNRLSRSSDFTTVTPLDKAYSQTSLQLQQEREEIDKLRRIYKQQQLQLARTEKAHLLRRIAEMTIQEQELNNSYPEATDRRSSVSLSFASEESNEESEMVVASEVTITPPVPMLRTTILHNKAPTEPSLPSAPPTPQRVPLARAKKRQRTDGRHNTIDNPIMEPYFRRGAANRSSRTTKSSKRLSRISSVTHSILNHQEVTKNMSDKGVQAYFADENVSLQQAVYKSRISSNYTVSDGVPSAQLSQAKHQSTENLEAKIGNLMQSVEDLQEMVLVHEIHEARVSERNSEKLSVRTMSDDRISVAQPVEMVHNARIDFSDNDSVSVHRNEEPRSTQSTVFDEQNFDISILIKSCSFKKKQLEKYKLYIALIGDSAQSSWVEIDTSLIQAKHAIHITIRAHTLGTIHAIRLMNPGSKVIKATLFDVIQVCYDDVEKGEITETFTIFQTARAPDQVHFLRGVKYRLTVQTDSKWFSGTDENIFVGLIGTRGVTDEIVLENNGQIAKTNQQDQFDISHADIGEIIGVKLRLNHKQGLIKTKKPKWNVLSVSAEVSRRMVDGQAEWGKKLDWYVNGAITTEQFVIGETSEDHFDLEPVA